MKRTAWFPFLMIAVLAGLLSGASLGTGWAGHIFSDVPNSPANVHDATEWLYQRGITIGCASGLYCPNDFVTRAQMALFMNRLGVALTPIVLKREESITNHDLSTNPYLCWTPSGSPASFTPSFPMQAVIDARVSLRWPSTNSDFYSSYRARAAYSTDGGTTWTDLNADSGGLEGSTQTWSLPAHFGNSERLDLVPSTSYRFAVRVGTALGGYINTLQIKCNVLVTITNRNLAPAPLAAPQRQPASPRTTAR